jgi:hypothetical protein
MKLQTAIAALLPAAALAVYGVDISAPLDQNTANCFVQQAGVSFGKLRTVLWRVGFVASDREPLYLSVPLAMHRLQALCAVCSAPTPSARAAFHTGPRA